MTGSAGRKRAARALERQLAYQRQKAVDLAGAEERVVAFMEERSAAVAAKLARVQPLPADAKVLEVGSGAHGLIFAFPAADKIGVDPLADHYRNLFPAWQERAPTIAAFGERLPFADATFDIVLSDNVVDHAENPRRIVEEMIRVVKPGGLIYFTVHIHHPLYGWASTLHAAWRSIGIPFEVAPFADHTVHFTRERALKLFDGLPVILSDVSDTIEETKGGALDEPPRHLGDRLKRWFFKNAEFEVIAVRAG